MAGNARNQAQAAPAPAPTSTPPRGPFTDSAPRHTRLEEWSIPDRDGLWDEVTKDYGSIRVVYLQRLSPRQEKHVLASLKGDGSQIVVEMSRRSLVQVKSLVGDREEVFRVAEHDGSSDALWAQIDPRIRLLVMKAYQTASVPSDEAVDDFLASRRTIVE